MRNNDPNRCAFHLDGYCKNQKLLADQSYIEHVVRRIASEAKMRIIDMSTSNVPLDLAKLELPAFEDEGGISVLALISTSHICLHVWPERSAFMFDIVSCKRFSVPVVEQVLCESIMVDNVTRRYISE